MKVEETNVLLDAHVATEKKLTTHAAELHNMLDTTIGDVNGLHGKIDRKVVVETHNLTAGERFHAETKDSIASLKNQAAAFVSAQIDGFKSMTARVADASGLSDRFASSLKEALGKLQKQTEESLNGAKNSVEELASQQRSSMENLGATWNQHAGEFRDTTTKISDEIRASIAAISATVEAHREHMKAMSNAMLEETKAAASALGAFVTLHRSSIENMDTSITNAMASYKTKWLMLRKTFVISSTRRMNARRPKCRNLPACSWKRWCSE